MVLGISLSAFTTFHVVLSLIGIVAGLVVAVGPLRGAAASGWVALFLATTIATSVTGFLFPVSGVLPSHVFGVLSLVALGPAVFAVYGRDLAGPWRKIFVVTALFALYLNCFVAVVQGFLKLGFLHALAPTQSVAPFAVALGVLLVVVLWLGWRAWRAGVQ